jgi:WD40 repeat protein
LNLDGQASAASAPPVAAPDYQLVRRIGRGSYGEVWLARTVTGRHRALKVVHRGRFPDERPYEREFMGIRRYEPVSRSHESLVTVFHVGRNETAGCFYYVMELADDARRAEERDPEGYVPNTLAQAVSQRGPLSAEECVRIGMALCHALAHLHRHGLVHRDIKPSNIIFVSGIPKLADIGLVAGAGASRSFVGTEGFVPPEGPGSVQADLFSLGKVLYEMSTGRDARDFPKLPVQWAARPDHRQLVELNEILLRACAAEARERYPSAEEMLADLANVQSGRSVKRLRLMEIRFARLTRLLISMLVLTLGVTGAWYWAARQAGISERAFRESEQLRVRARTSERIARQRLGESLQNQARQSRLTRQLGQRVEALRAVHELALVKPSAAARDEGIAALALWDLEATGVAASLPENATAYALDSDLHRYAVGTADGALEVGTFGGNTFRLHEAGTMPWVDLLHFSPAGRFLAARYRNLSCQIWDLEKRSVVLSTRWVTGPTKPDRAFDFTPDGRRAASAVTERVVRFFELPDWRHGPALDIPEKPTWLAFAPSGTRLAVVANKRVDIWNSANLTLESSFQYERGVFCAGWHPDERLLAVGTLTGEVILWDPQAGVSRALEAHSERVLRAVFNPAGDRLLTTANDATTRVWDPGSGRPLLWTDRGFGWQFSADGKRLGFLRQRRDASVFNVIESETFRVLHLPWGSPNWVAHLDVSADGRQIAVARGNGWTLLDLASGRELASVQDEYVDTLVFGPGSGELYAGSAAGIRLWRLQGGEAGGAWRAEGRGVVWPEPNIMRLATGVGRSQLAFGALRSVGLAKLAGGPTAELGDRQRLSGSNVCDVALSPDGNWLAFSMWYNAGTTVRHLRNPSRSRDLDRHTARLAFSPNGKWLVTGTGAAFQFWDVGHWAAGPKVQRDTATDYPGALTFSPDGKVLAIAQSWRLVKLLDADTGAELASLTSPDPQQITALAFSPDGSQLLVGTGARAVQVWNLQRLRVALGELGLAQTVRF